jgi:hypothetical protein
MQNQNTSMVQEGHEAEKREFVTVRRADLERIVALLSRLEDQRPNEARTASLEYRAGEQARVL